MLTDKWKGQIMTEHIMYQVQTEWFNDEKKKEPVLSSEAHTNLFKINFIKEQ